MNNKKYDLDFNVGNYKSIFNSIPTPIYIWKKQSDELKLIGYNRSAEIITEGKISEFLGIRLSDLYTKGSKVFNDIKKCFNEHINFSKEMVYKYKSTGKEKILYVTYNYLPPDFVIVFTADITKQKEAENLLKEAEREKAIILETISEHIVYQDTDGSIIWTNKAAGDSVGLTVDQMIGKKCYKIWAGRNERCPGCPIKSSIEKGKPVFGEIKTPDERYWFVRGFPVLDENKKVIAIVEITTEITKIKQAEDELKKSEERFRRMAENIRDGLTIVENDKIVYLNDRAVEIFGYPKKELMLLTGNDNTTPKEKERLRALREKIIQKGETPSEINFWIITKDGKRKFIKNRYSSLKQNNGVINRYVITTDFTEYKEAEEKLKDSELQYRNTINSMADAIHVLDRDLKILLFNPAVIEWLEFLGFDINILGKKLNDAFPFLPEKVLDEYKQVLNSGRILITEEETTIGGKTYFTESRKIPIFIDGVTTQIITIVRDISKRKISERKLKKSEKKYREAYNRSNFYKDLFAHDINNIFQNIQSSTELLSLLLDEINISKGNNYIDIIKDQIIRGSNLISNVRKLSELEEIEFPLKKVELFEILDDVRNFIIKSFHNKRINLEIHSKEDKIYLNANELLADVFENILINAIRYNKNSLIELKVKVSKDIFNGNNFIRIEFIDNGIGIPNEMKKKVFQRGYNHKSIMKGLGLGLTLVKKIINIYNGQIWVEDRVQGDYSKGSIFIILIPEVE